MSGEMYELTPDKLANARKKLAKIRAAEECEPIVDPLGRAPDGAAVYLVWTDHSHYLVTFRRDAAGRRLASCECAGASYSKTPRGCFHVAAALGPHLTWARREQQGEIIRPVARVPRPRAVQRRIERFLSDYDRET